MKKMMVNMILQRLRILAEFEPSDTIREAYISFLRDAEKKV